MYKSSISKPSQQTGSCTKSKLTESCISQVSHVKVKANQCVYAQSTSKQLQLLPERRLRATNKVIPHSRTWRLPGLLITMWHKLSITEHQRRSAPHRILRARWRGLQPRRRKERRHPRSQPCERRDAIILRSLMRLGPQPSHHVRMHDPRTTR